MKSAGIITFQWFDNYGTVLQAYGLQTALRGMGVDAQIIPLRIRERTGLLSFVSKSWRGFLTKINNYLWQKGSLRPRLYSEFRQSNFNYAQMPSLYFDEACSRIFSQDVLVFGSDNIWSPWCTSLDDSMGHLFYGTHVKHTNKIVYAASTAGYLSDHPRAGEVINRVKDAGFRSVSLREGANVDLFRKNGIDAVRVPDPAFLLTKDQWMILERKPEGVASGEYVLGYDLGHVGDVSIREACEQEARNSGLKVLIPFPKKYWRDRDVACYPSPGEWLWLIHHAKCVVTNSFHGVMFSLVYNVPFRFCSVAGGDKSLNMRAFEVLEKFRLLTNVIGQPVDWRIVNKEIDAFRETGLEYLKKNCLASDCRLAPELQCTGCSACFSACKQSAISMKPNDEGFLIPVIDSKKCVACGRCSRVCPIVNKGLGLPENVVKKPLCGCTKDDSVWIRSTSGGLFTEICKTGFNDGAVVFGAELASDMSVRHGEILSLENLDRLRRSKYVQSFLGNSFSRCREYLESGRNVIFAGTPCQIAGLKSYLGNDHERLLTVEVICHGVTSPKMFKSYLKHLSAKYGKDVVGYEFRAKTDNAHVANYCSRILFADGSASEESMDLYNRLFIGQLTVRSSCGGNCHFRSDQRYADITLADARRETEIYPWKGDKNWSVIVANTHKGQGLIDKLRTVVDLYDYPIEFLRKTNPNYFCSGANNPRRDDVFKGFMNHSDFEFWAKVSDFLPRPKPLLIRVASRCYRLIKGCK